MGTYNMNIASMLDTTEPIPLSSRFAKLKRNMIACRERDVAESFYRLLRALRREADEIAARGSDVIPTIDYFDIGDGEKAAEFRAALRKRGVAVIKRVVPLTVAQTWQEETLEYIADNPHARGYPSHDPRLFDLYWSPSQIRARVDSRLLDAQRFAMGTWHASDEDALVSPEYPVVYADRVRVQTPDDIPVPVPVPVPVAIPSASGGPHVDNGSVERWEPDGYGASGTYGAVFSGRWEDYDPWDSSPRLHISTDLYNRSGSCSMFRMFQGFLSLSAIPAGSGALTVCPMLQLSTAYFLLRPFFTPRYKNLEARMNDGGMGMEMGLGMGMGMGMGMGAGKKGSDIDFLHPNNWNLNVSQTSVLHGAVPGYVQELSAALHPHLQLHRTMVSVPDLEPGDYVIWHPDAIHAIHAASPSYADASSLPMATGLMGSTFNPNIYSPLSFSPSLPSSAFPFFSTTASASTSASISSPFSSNPSSRSGSLSLSNFVFGNNNSISSSTTFSSTVPSSTCSTTLSTSPSTSTSLSATTATNTTTITASPTTPHHQTRTVLYVPSCPLTQTNALYLSRQRRAFLLGHAAPDFAEPGSAAAAERDHAARSGVQDVADAGGEDGLRSMGLAPFEESSPSLSRSSRSRAAAHRECGGDGGGGAGEVGGTAGEGGRERRREREKDARLLRLANGILFPDRFDGVLKKGGRNGR